MDFLGVDGKHYPVKINYSDNKSELHKEALFLIKSLYPLIHIAEDTSIKINRSTTLFIDIMIFSLGVAIEVNGKQHDEYTHFFHKNKTKFAHAQYLDSQKEEWCRINKFKLIKLNWNETKYEWSNKLRQTISRKT